MGDNFFALGRVELDRLSWLRVFMRVLSALNCVNSTSEQATTVSVRTVWYEIHHKGNVGVSLCVVKHCIL